MSEAEALVMALCSVPVTRDSAPPSDLGAGPAIGAGCAGGACWPAWLFLLSSHGLAERFPGTIGPKGSELICVSKHPPPLRGKGPAQPLRAAGMVLCGSGRVFRFGFWFLVFFIPPFVCPLIFFFPPVSFN